jgi:hypothetical protein
MLSYRLASPVDPPPTAALGKQEEDGMPFHEGQVVYLPCEVAPGAFTEECLVTVDTAYGPMSGFVRHEHLRDVQGTHAMLRGVVVAVEDSIASVRLNGSFFTTTGLTRVASSHLHAA